MEGGIGDGAGQWWNAWGGALSSFGATAYTTKNKNNNVMALNGHQTEDKDSTINKNERVQRGGVEHDVRAVGSMGGDTIRSFPWRPCEVVIKIKIN
jgi:hypothetical protein